MIGVRESRKALSSLTVVMGRRLFSAVTHYADLSSYIEGLETVMTGQLHSAVVTPTDLEIVKLDVGRYLDKYYRGYTLVTQSNSFYYSQKTS